MTYKKICEHCGKEFECKHTSAKLCPDCRKEYIRIDNLNRYYAKKGLDKRIEFTRNSTPPPKGPSMFKWNKPPLSCKFDACPFKSGNKPCLFYFEYKDGTASCPGAKYAKGR